MARTLAMLTLIAAWGVCASQPAPSTARWPSTDYGAGETKTISVDGFEIAYLDKGEGPPILVFHPGTGFHGWQSFIEQASDGHRVIAPDGFTFSVPRLVALAEALDLGRVHLVSHSIGGWLAVHLATTHSDLVRSLVLVEPAYSPTLESAAVQAAAFQREPPSCGLVAAPEPVLDACRFVNGLSGPGYFESIPEPVRTRAIEANANANIRQALIEAGQEPFDPARAPVTPGRNSSRLSSAGWQLEFPPICEQERTLTMPILFIRGEVSSAASQIGLDAHETCLPPHETAIIERAAHNAHIDNPEAFNRAVLEFLRDD